MESYTSQFRHSEENLQPTFCKYKEKGKGSNEYTAESRLSMHNSLPYKHWYVWTRLLSSFHATHHFQKGWGDGGSTEDMLGQGIHFLCFTVSITGRVGMFVSVVHWSWCSRQGILHVIGCLYNTSVLQPTAVCCSVYQLHERDSYGPQNKTAKNIRQLYWR